MKSRNYDSGKLNIRNMSHNFKFLYHNSDFSVILCWNDGVLYPIYQMKICNYGIPSQNYEMKSQNYDLKSWNWPKIIIMTESDFLPQWHEIMIRSWKIIT